MIEEEYPYVCKYENDTEDSHRGNRHTRDPKETAMVTKTLWKFIPPDRFFIAIVVSTICDFYDILLGLGVFTQKGARSSGGRKGRPKTRSTAHINSEPHF
jgi:hypothetical protein